MSAERKWYVVGANCYGECGVNNGGTDIIKLTDLHKSNPHLTNTIKHIYNGNQYTIYCDDKDTLWTSGHNKHYSCCTHENAEHIPSLKLIDYFNTNVHTVYKKASHDSDSEQVTTKKEEKTPATKETISVKQICASVSGYCTFFITTNINAYGNGNNRKYQLGFDKKESEWWRNGSFRYKCEPKHITAICKNLIDIKSSTNYSLALRMSDKAVMFLYCNRSKYKQGLQLHEDAFQLIVAYVGQLSDEDCAVYIAGNGRFGWKPIKMFMHKDIINIECGKQHALALESDGVLWSFGDNRYLQCGPLWTWAEDKALKSIKHPMAITYFKDNKIEIKEMKCGWYHNLVIDKNNNVYAFGRNNFGQCGYVVRDGSDSSLCHVQLMKALENYKIKSVECGANHSYVETMDGKHFLFGKNNVNQCVTYDNKQEFVANPYCINQIVKEKTNGGIIKKVTLGVDNTQIMILMCNDL